MAILVSAGPRQPRACRTQWAFTVATIVFLLMSAGQAQAHGDARYSALVVDAISGDTLFEDDAEGLRYPASLTKMMTLFILFEELEAGRLSTDSELNVSEYAASMPASKLGVRAGGTLTVDEAIKALAVKSANDVAVVVAENISGSVDEFARRMTRTAQAIGMENTTFANPHGLPDSSQKSTARDMAALGLALHDRFPEYFDVFGLRTFTHGKRTFRNTNGLLGAVEGIEGIKTGYTRASGFNLVTSVKRGNRHIVAVVMGGQSSASRNAHMRKLIERYLPNATTGADLVAEVDDGAPELRQRGSCEQESPLGPAGGEPVLQGSYSLLPRASVATKCADGGGTAIALQSGGSPTARRGPLDLFTPQGEAAGTISHWPFSPSPVRPAATQTP